MIKSAEGSAGLLHKIRSQQCGEEECKYSRGHKKYITLFYVWRLFTKLHFILGSEKIFFFYITRFVSAEIFLHCTIPLLSCKYESLTQGNRLNPNHDGSSTERDVPKQSSHARVWCTLNFACCTIKGEYIAHTLF